MKISCPMVALMALVFCGMTPLVGQEMALQRPGPEFDALKSDLGTWDVEIRTWGGAGEPTVTMGKETNRMLGGFWLLSDFQGDMMGMVFKGHGIYSYDAEKKHYVGTWVDSLSAKKMDMIGKHDQDNQTMTYEGMAPGVDGTPTKHVLTTQYKNDGTRVMTMHMKAGETMVKIFEMNFTKAADDSVSKTES